MRWVKKWWLIAVILAIACVIGWKEKRCQAQANECRASYAPQAQPERLSGTISVYQQASEQEAIAAACEPNGYFCRLFGAANLPTMLLVIVGIGAIGAAVKTLRVINRQADIMDRQTKTTEDSVKAFIESERAWLMGDKVGVISAADPDQPRAVYWISVPMMNFGKTVAHIYETSAKAGIYSHLPPIPDYPQLPPCDFVVVPGGFRDLWVGIQPQDMDYIRKRSGANLLYVYGFVKYRDIGKNERESRFCYFYQIPTTYHPDPEGFYPCGNAPSAYTKCT
ncbi:MAG: hypothetical protein ACYDDI_04275 [Candidatus Acidiferrales bacterium]